MNTALVLEFINGPRDGERVELTSTTEWTRAGSGVLSCAWDLELGTPQARIQPDADGWVIEAVKAAHGTYRLNPSKAIDGKLSLRPGDELKASSTWLLVVSCPSREAQRSGRPPSR